METQLTPEFADSVRLPILPHTRTSAVKRILSDPEILGESFGVSVGESNATIWISYEKGQEVHMTAIAPKPAFLGRSALRKVAGRIQEFETVE